MIKNHKLSYLFLTITVIGIYFQSLNYGFIWDDFTYIINNSNLDPGSNLLNLWSPRGNSADFWPVTYSLFWFIRNFLGSEPVYFHIVNITLFTASALLVYKILSLLKIEFAFLIALIFAVHPMNVPLVAWSFQIKTNLANVFGLASIVFLIFSLRGQFLKKYYILSLLFFALSLLSKINLIFLPVLVFIFLLLNKKSFKDSLMPVLPFFLMSLTLGILNVTWDANALPTPESEMILDPSYINRFFIIGKNFWFYLYKTFLPLDLVFSYKKYPLNYSNALDLLPSIVLTAFLLVCAYKILISRNLSYFSFGILISFVLLFPVLGLVEIYYMRFSNVAEHYLSIGMLGFLFSAFYLIKNKKVLNALFIFPVLLCVQTLNYLPDYKDEETVLLKTIEKNDESILAHNVLGSFYKKKEENDKALYHYQKSIQIKPTAQAYFNLATTQEKLNLLDQARHSYEISRELNPYIAQTDINLGAVYLRLNNPQVAIEYFKKALQKDPGASNALYNIGYTYEKILNNPSEAYKWYLSALQLYPTNNLFLESVKRVQPNK